MSNEVKQTQQFVLRAMAKNYAGGHNWDHLDSEACVKAADEIRALEAECERLRGLFEESEKHLHHWQRQAAANGRSTKAMEQKRDALAAELAAIRAAGGEEVEVVAWMWRDLNGDVQFNYMHPEGQELMTVAQHRRLMAEQLERERGVVEALRRIDRANDHPGKFNSEIDFIVREALAAREKNHG